ncbi:MAG TPA: ComEC/Rec2 family competence protein, partial [Candidatus Paceibacterota bacterium]|nr:ComEC/Rec2 family competence protein [Candidatus Paceibacterota bacterium]
VIVAFTLLTGAATVTVRAAIMAIVSLSIRTAGRKYAPLRALTFALGIMVVINPLILAFDAAFQISVSSVVGLVLLSEPISRKIGFISERWGMREIVSATLSTQIFSMPLIMFYMGEVSVISIIPNIVLLPFLPWILLLGVVLLVLGFFGAAAGVPAAAPFAWVMKLLLSYVLWTVQSYGSLPFSSIKMTVGPFGLTVMFAFVFAFTIWLRRNCSRTSAN